MTSPAPLFFFTAPGQPAFSEEVCTQAFEPTRPYPQNPLAIIYRARFKQLRAYYMRPAANTPHPNLPQVYFVDDVDFQDKTSGLIEWTRVYSTLPTSWNDFSSTAYTFPGLSGIRVPVSKTVTEKIIQDYYLVGDLTTFTNGVANYDNLAALNWGGTGSTRGANATTIPVCAGGINVAAMISDTNANTVHQWGAGAVAGLFAGNVAASVFVKAGTNPYLLVGIFSAGGTLDAWGKTDLNTGAVTSQNAAYFDVSAIGDGWYRVGIIGNSPNSGSSIILQSLAARDGTNVYTGNGSYYYAWRAQLLNGNAIPHATVPPTLAGDGSTNYPVASADVIPVKFGLQYIYQWSQNVAAEYLDGGTSPNINTYNNYVSTDAANSSNGTASYSIESADSTLSLWQGSIWQRQRHFVKAR